MSDRREQWEYYQQLEEQLTVLLTVMAERMEPKRLKLPKEFVEHAEYGLALEFLCEAITDDQVAVTDTSYAAIESLGRTMQLAPELWERLRPLVIPG